MDPDKTRTRLGLSFPLGFQKAGVFAGGVELKLEVAGGDDAVRFGFHVATKDGIGVTMVAAEELLRQGVEGRGLDEESVQTDGAGEDGDVIRDSPAYQLFLDVIGRAAGEKTGEALGVYVGIVQFRFPLDGF